MEEVQGMIVTELTKEDFAYFEGCSDWVPVADIPGIDDVVLKKSLPKKQQRQRRQRRRRICGEKVRKTGMAPVSEPVQKWLQVARDHDYASEFEVVLKGQRCRHHGINDAKLMRNLPKKPMKKRLRAASNKHEFKQHGGGKSGFAKKLVPPKRVTWKNVAKEFVRPLEQEGQQNLQPKRAAKKSLPRNPLLLQ